MIPDMFLLPSQNAWYVGRCFFVFRWFRGRKLCRWIKTHLQSRLGLAVAERGTDPVGGALLLGAGGQHVAAALAHVVLLLHGGVLEVLVEGEGKGDADEEGRGGEDPGALAAEGQDAPGAAGEGAHAVGDPAAGLGRHDVAQGVEALGEGLVLGVKVRVVGDFGVCAGVCVSNRISTSHGQKPRGGASRAVASRGHIPVSE